MAAEDDITPAAAPKEGATEEDVGELFVACRFAEASKRAADLLLEEEKMESKDDQANGTAIPAEWNPPIVAIDASCTVRLDDSCTKADRLAAVLLQCAHELNRQDEEAAFCRFYAHRRPMPFPVAAIWLQLWLARGELGNARPVLESLLTSLRQAISNPNRTTGDTLAEMHSEVAGMLVERTLLPLGDYHAAKEWVSTDPHLDQVQRQHLMVCCEAAERSAKPTSNSTAQDRGKGGGGSSTSSNGRSSLTSSLDNGRSRYCPSAGAGGDALMSSSRSSSYLTSLLAGTPNAVRECLYPRSSHSHSTASGFLTRTLQRGELRRLLLSMLSLAVLLVGFHFRRGVRERGRQALVLVRKVARALGTLLLGEL